MHLSVAEAFMCHLQGLGKTLQGITLLWTLLNSGHELLGGNPIAKRVIIVCPTSLVNNWCAFDIAIASAAQGQSGRAAKAELLFLHQCRDAECTKWLQVIYLP